MKHYQILLLLPLVVTGCATTDMQGALDSMNGLGNRLEAAFRKQLPPQTRQTATVCRAPRYITPCARSCPRTDAPRSGRRW